MTVKSDIEIAREAKMKPIMEIGAKLGIPAEDLIPYGHTKAKIQLDYINRQESKKNGKDEGSAGMFGAKKPAPTPSPTKPTSGRVT